MVVAAGVHTAPDLHAHKTIKTQQKKRNETFFKKNILNEITTLIRRLSIPKATEQQTIIMRRYSSTIK